MINFSQDIFSSSCGKQRKTDAHVGLLWWEASLHCAGMCLEVCVKEWLPFKSVRRPSQTPMAHMTALPGLAIMWGPWPTWQQRGAGCSGWGHFPPSLSVPDGGHGPLTASSTLPLPGGCSSLRASHRHGHQVQLLLLWVPGKTAGHGFYYFLHLFTWSRWRHVKIQHNVATTDTGTN